MSTRREFLKQVASTSVAAAASVQVTRAAEATAVGPKTSMKTHKVPHTGLGVSRIKSAIRRDETTLRLGGVGDGYHMSWAADDRQFVAVQDGVGWSENPKGMYNSRLWAITGGPQNAMFQEIPGYPYLMPAATEPRYYGFGTLALEGRIYQYLCTLNHMTDRPVRWVGAKLIFSLDNGRSWCNQDGSTPVVWESWQNRSRKNMVFFEEPQEAFSLLAVLQMGRNYEANRDGYVYVYAPNGNTDGTMNQLVMFRVPKAHILNRGAYEYFAGLRPDGNATWVKDINARAIVHTFPRGWVNTALHPGEIVVESWLPSVTYNAPLGLYMMANTGIGSASDGSWFGKPSYLGFWVAPNPWGPWTQIHEETAWTPGNDPAARAYDLQIAPKWIAADGKSFWLVWADFQQKADKGELQRLEEESKPATTQADFIRIAQQMRRMMPYYAFNTQRVDLVIA